MSIAGFAFLFESMDDILSLCPCDAYHRPRAHSRQPMAKPRRSPDGSMSKETFCWGCKGRWRPAVLAFDRCRSEHRRGGTWSTRALASSYEVILLPLQRTLVYGHSRIHTGGFPLTHHCKIYTSLDFSCHPSFLLSIFQFTVLLLEKLFCPSRNVVRSASPQEELGCEKPNTRKSLSLTPEHLSVPLHSCAALMRQSEKENLA